jgi:peptide/nickel transport system permease protein
MVGVLAGLVVASFALARVSRGDPVRLAAGMYATPAAIRAARERLGLDHSLGEQFVGYLANLVHLNLGLSFQTGEPVTQVIGDRIGNTFALAGASLLLVLITSIPIGMLAAAQTQGGRHPILEFVFSAVTSLVSNIPAFLAATVLALVLGVWLGWLPLAGSDSVQALVMPVLAVSALPIAALARMVRLETLNVLAQDYIRTARSKDLTALRIYVRHVLPNVLTATLTISGVYFASLVGGAVIVENVFARAGLGTALVQAVLSGDYPVIQGVMLLLGFVIVAVNAIVDLTLALVDPRSSLRVS